MTKTTKQQRIKSLRWDVGEMLSSDLRTTSKRQTNPGRRNDQVGFVRIKKQSSKQINQHVMFTGRARDADNMVRACNRRARENRQFDKETFCFKRIPSRHDLHGPWEVVLAGLFMRMDEEVMDAWRTLAATHWHS